VSLDCKIHDFYAICPSQHLLNSSEKYCGVPQDPKICEICLKENRAAHWASSRPVDIAEWRRPFTQLFDAANVINVFDRSSIDILRRGFSLEDRKFRVTPHSSDFFNCDRQADLSGQLHIGILGTLTTIKGGAVLDALSRYVGSKNFQIPITVVGRSVVPVGAGIKVLGAYEINDLPGIVHRERINAILMPTIVPETFSYTISEAMKMGLPIVAFDIGAQGERVKKYRFGKVVPLDSAPDIVFEAVQSAWKLAQKVTR
jgi:hypothetical protein